MRWRDATAELPLRPVAELLERLPQLAVRLAGPGDAGPVVLFADALRRAVFEHLRSSDDEQGGLLLGEVYTSGTTREPRDSVLVLVTRSVPATEFASDGWSLRMEPAVWEQARQVRSAHELVVGWYHSHPGLGAFFSSTDRRTQAAFFAHPYSVGWVVDPLGGGEAVFVGAGSARAADVLVLPADYGVGAGGAVGGSEGTTGTASAGASTISNPVT